MRCSGRGGNRKRLCKTLLLLAGFGKRPGDVYSYRSASIGSSFDAFHAG
jgi:hypothetical protein